MRSALGEHVVYHSWLCCYVRALYYVNIIIYDIPLRQIEESKKRSHLRLRLGGNGIPLLCSNFDLLESLSGQDGVPQRGCGQGDVETPFGGLSCGLANPPARFHIECQQGDLLRQ